MKYDLITLLGPTASGKTSLAAAVAARLDAEIISGDSRQIYRRMDLGTGKDLADYTVDGKTIPYHLIDIAEPGYKYNVFEFQRDFLKAVGKKLVSEFSIDQASDLISVISNSIHTNMPVKDMIWFYINVARTMDFDNDLTFDALPGTTTGRYKKQDYVFLDPQSTLDYINEKINPFTTDIALSELNIIHLED